MAEDDAKDTESTRQADSPGSQDEATPKSMADMSACMDQFSKTFEASARRWELIVYPSLIAFIILAAYGFFLIYNLTNDVDRITAQMDVIADAMVQVSENMNDVSGNMANVSRNMDEMNGYMKSMNEGIYKQEVSLNKMAVDIDKMSTSIADMSVTVFHMRQDVGRMGYNVNSASRPMQFMNQFVPW